MVNVGGLQTVDVAYGCHHPCIRRKDADGGGSSRPVVGMQDICSSHSKVVNENDAEVDKLSKCAYVFLYNKMHNWLVVHKMITCDSIGNDFQDHAQTMRQPVGRESSLVMSVAEQVLTIIIDVR